jgi:hypothetical protein
VVLQCAGTRPRQLPAVACLTIQTDHDQSATESTNHVRPTCKHFNNPTNLLAELNHFVFNIPKPWDEDQSLTSQISPTYGCCYCRKKYTIYVIVPVSPHSVIEGAGHLVVLYRYIDLGEITSRHDGTWADLTRPRPSSVFVTSPFDLKSRASVRRRLVGRSVAGSALSVHEEVVLPLLD